MFLDQRLLPNVGIKIIIGQRQQIFQKDIEINQTGGVNLNELIARMRQNYQIQPHSLFFFHDHSRNTFEFLNEQSLLSIHFTSLISEDSITFKCQPKLSDQILANPQKMDEESRSKRSRQRVIEEAFVLVQQWRYFYREGIHSEYGKKLNLDQSAEIIGIPRKTLEDYFLVLRTGKNFKFDFRKNRKEKIGVLRSFVREIGKNKNTSQKQFDERQFFQQMRFQLQGFKPQEQVFNVLNSHRSHSSSDEDMIFQN